MDIRRALLMIRSRLSGLTQESARESEIALTHRLALSRAQLLTDKERELSPDDVCWLEDFIARRNAGEPIQYILGEAPFMGFEFFVGPGVLIPRQDTETLCECAADALPRGGRLLDLCTGSGCIAISISRLRPDADVTGSDISKRALFYARENARRLCARARFVRGDLFGALCGETYDVIACNPPYIRSAEMPFLQIEVQKEPAQALLGGEDGLLFYRRIARDAPGYLRPKGALCFESGYSQARDIACIMRDAGFRDISFVRDAGGTFRVVWGRIE